MLTDRGACADLDDPRPEWLDEVTTLHVPLYSLVGDPLAATARTLIGWAHERGIDVSVDVSSVALVESIGAPVALSLLVDLRPDVVFANADEARALGTDVIGSAVVVVKHGAEPALVVVDGTTHRVPIGSFVGVADSTGAGDAFAAGFLTSDWHADVVDACRSGHDAAAIAIGSRRR